MKKILIFTLFVSVCLLAGCGKEPGGVWEWLDLGQKYLLEESYEEAAAAFEKAIAVDEKNVEAYAGLAKAYIGQGDEQGAREILKKGYEMTQAPALLEEAEALEAEAETESLPAGAAEGELEKEEEGMRAAEPSEFLDGLGEALKSGEYVKAGEQLFTPEMDELLEGGRPVLFPLSGDPAEGGGKGIGLYGLEDGQRCIYYGDYVNGGRNGQGIWIWAPGAVFDGSWSEDRPNGKGRLYYVGGSCLEGLLQDGRWDGEVVHSSEGTEDTVLVFKDGYPVIRGSTEEAEDEPYTLIMSREGSRIYTCSRAQSEVPWGVNGFVPELPF